MANQPNPKRQDVMEGPTVVTTAAINPARKKVSD